MRLPVAGVPCEVGIPEQDRAYGSIGGAYPITSNLTIEGAFLRVFAGGKRGRVVERSARSQTAVQLNTGKYELNANVFSFSLKANYRASDTC